MTTSIPLASLSALAGVALFALPLRADAAPAAGRTAIVEFSAASSGGAKTVQRAHLLLPPGDGHADLEITGAEGASYEVEIDVGAAKRGATPFRIAVEHQVGEGGDASRTRLHTAGSAARGEAVTIGRLVRPGADITVSLTIQ